MIKKIVLTGGPGAGKSTIINFLKENLEKKGYKVITVSETATDLYNYKILFEPGKTDVFDFQNLILNLQYTKEKSLDDYLFRCEDEEPIIVLYDRGIFDNRAYLPDDGAFNKLLEINNLNGIDLLDNYDLVIDMVSASLLNDDVYENNDLRNETKEEAKMLDKKTAEAWLLHHNFNIVMPALKIEDKNNNVLNIINDNLSNNKKIDYHYVKDDNINYEDFNNGKYKKINELDVYIKLGGNDLDFIASCNAPYDSDFIVTQRMLNFKTSYLYRIISHKDNDILYKSNKITEDAFKWLIGNHDIIKSESNKYVKYLDDYKVNEIKFNKNGAFRKVLN